MLEPNPEIPWPAGIKVNKQLIQVPLKDNSNITVIVENNTEEEVTHNVTMTYLQRLCPGFRRAKDGTLQWTLVTYLVNNRNMLDSY